MRGIGFMYHAFLFARNFGGKEGRRAARRKIAAVYGIRKGKECSDN